MAEIASPSAEQWIHSANAELQRQFGITFVDAGLTEEQLRDYSSTFASPRGFVEWFGEKYDLTPLRELDGW